MDRKSIQLWLDKYVEAWRTYDPAQIGELFSEDALYFYSPWDEDDPIRGREAIVAEWRREPDASGSWEAHYAPLVVEGDVAVAQGRTRYVRPDGSIDRQFNNISYSTSIKQGVVNVLLNGTCSRVAPNPHRPRDVKCNHYAEKIMTKKSKITYSGRYHLACIRNGIDWSRPVV